jgi:hypothetical protein
MNRTYVREYPANHHELSWRCLDERPVPEGEPDTYVLFWLVDLDSGEDRYSIGIYDFEDREYGVLTDDYEDDVDIIAWMPMPGWPKGEEGERLN